MIRPIVTLCRSRVAMIHKKWLVLLAIAMSAGVIGAVSIAEPVGPSSQDRAITRAVTLLLNRDHLSQHLLDDEISERCLTLYLEALDPWRAFFYQSDIDQFNKYATQLDDMVRAGDVKVAYEIYDVYLKRFAERVTTINELLDKGFDFTQDEELIIDRKEIGWPKTPEEARDLWRMRLKYDMLVMMSDEDEADGEEKMTEEEAIAKLRRRYDSRLKQRRNMKSEALLELYLSSLTRAYDPHTTYMSPSTLKNFEIAMRLELEGIGASLQSEDGYTVIKKILPGGAADKDGRLKVEDKIIGVGQGTDGELVDIVDMNINDVVDQIRGKPNTTVRLQVVPQDGSGTKVYNIVRAKIELTDSEAQSAVFEAGLKADGQPYKLGVINLPSFYMDMDGARRMDPDFKSTTRDVRRILENFKKDGVDGVVLDLRANGGGSLTEAIDLTGLFIETGPVVQVKGPEGIPQVYPDRNPSVTWDGPLVVLISKFSASASEILAGAIQDYHRGLIVGDATTHGKGTVQSLQDIGRQLQMFDVPFAPQLGALKVTMQQFYRPNGESTQKHGVESDIELPSIITHLDVGEADLDYPVEFDKVPKAEYPVLQSVTSAMVDQLRQLSDKRTTENEDFQKVLKGIQRYKEQKAKKTVTVNREKFLAERAEMNADKQEEEAIMKMAGVDADQPAIDRDYYLDEALAITVDYIQLTTPKANAQVRSGQ